MKKKIIWSSVVAVVVAALIGGGVYAWMEYDKQQKEKESAEAKKSVEVVAEADFAYVNVEYVISQSEIFKTEGEALRAKTEKAQQRLTNREQDLQNKMQKLAEKYQKGLITTRDAQQQERQLQDEAAKFQASAQKKIQELEEENVVLQNRINDFVMRAVQAVNSNKQYKMIIQSSALLDADEAYNLSEKVLAEVNALYAAEKAEKKANK
ncbi:MAG: OmpH family outer membrane protein [Alistipes sp.]|nr:OmpH family outer membrane protein [Alistipes sp.]MBQ5836607.1 OmpH family outer membrane protein [Alistipes sp.]